MLPFSPQSRFDSFSEPAQLRILADILKYYSEPEQKDDNRMNCVLGLATLKPRFKSILKLDFDIYLTLMSTLVKLLLDELAPVAIRSYRSERRSARSSTLNRLPCRMIMWL